MTTLLNMPSAVSIPCFIPASKTSEGNLKNDDLGLLNDGELDFDLLADYLLEEADGYDFSTQPSSCHQDQQISPTATPDVSDIPEIDFVDPLADATVKIDFPSEIPQAQVKQDTFKPLPSVPVNVMQLSSQVPNPPPVAGMTSPPSLFPLAQSSKNSEAMLTHQNKRQRIQSSASNQRNSVQIQSTVNTVKPVSLPSTTANQTAPFQMTNNTLVDQRAGGRQKSQAQIDRRRERNRILARRTRLRKKFFFESLQKEVTDLQKENLVLREIVKSKIGKDQADTILKDCKANEELPQVVLEHCGDPLALSRQDFNLIASIKQSQESFVITDPSLQDNPIVYASEGFLELTGYSREQVLGRNCRFLQGTDTDSNKVAEIRKGLLNGDDVSVTIRNYCADGTPFWNKLFIAALRDAQNNIVNYIGVSVKVAGDPNEPTNENDGVLNGNSTVKMLSNETAEEATLDFDAAVMAIEGAVTAAVEAAPKMVNHHNTTSHSS